METANLVSHTETTRSSYDGNSSEAVSNIRRRVPYIYAKPEDARGNILAKGLADLHAHAKFLSSKLGKTEVCAPPRYLNAISKLRRLHICKAQPDPTAIRNGRRKRKEDCRVSPGRHYTHHPRHAVCYRSSSCRGIEGEDWQHADSEHTHRRHIGTGILNEGGGVFLFAVAIA